MTGELVRKGRMTPMTEMVEARRKINAKVQLLSERKAKIDARIEVLAKKSHDLGRTIDTLSEKSAGIFGHMDYMELGATHYQLCYPAGGWTYIEFFNEAGEKVVKGADE